MMGLAVQGAPLSGSGGGPLSSAGAHAASDVAHHSAAACVVLTLIGAPEASAVPGAEAERERTADDADDADELGVLERPRDVRVSQIAEA
jgi:hypothetical protein